MPPVLLVFAVATPGRWPVLQFTLSGFPAGLKRVVVVSVAALVAVLVVAVSLRGHVDGRVLLGCQALRLEEQVARQDDEVKSQIYTICDNSHEVFQRNVSTKLTFIGWNEQGFTAVHTTAHSKAVHQPWNFCSVCLSNFPLKG